MTTTAFITHSSKNAAPDRLLGAALRQAGAACAQRMLRLLASLLLVGMMALGHAPASAGATDIVQFKLERVEDGLALSSQVQFELSPVVEDALLKGIPLFFVYEADTYRDRWYWTDQRVASTARTIRLAYQPLTRRWRVNIASGVIGSSGGLRASLNQNYDTLDEALTGIQRLSRWKFADNTDLTSDSALRLEFSFRLDLSQLPRPFQIGVAGQSDWAIATQLRERIRPELLHADPVR